MLNANVFRDVLVKRLVGANRIPAVHSPLIPPLHKPGRWESGEALNAFKRTENTRVGVWQMSMAKVVLFLLFVGLTLSVQAGVREVGAIGITVGDLDRELIFYTNTLPFELVSISEAVGKEQDVLLGLSDVKLRVALLKLGSERITMMEHLVNKGRPIPADSQSYDHWFQHIAIVVRDMDMAYEQLRQHKVKHVSTAPQTLPVWNKGAAGIKAFYFRDPEDHVLEIIFFPPGKGDPKWQHPGTNVFLGIDHTAIVVSDTDKSLAFYRDLLGMRVVGQGENYGVEQEHLNQVFGARLHITTLRAERGPGIEFLQYIAPPGGRTLPANAKANDLLFWHTDLIADGFNNLVSVLSERETRLVSTLPPGLSALPNALVVRDPDGHAIKLIHLIDRSLSTLVNPNTRAGNP